MWRAYRRHFATRVQDPVVVPLAGGGAVAIAPYVGYRGFPVRWPYWRGVYVYHRDGRLEDLTPEEAMQRPELAGSGRLYPERLAREIADAHARRDGYAVTDPPGNAQPYLTNFGDGRIRWVTVGQAHDDEERLAIIVQTDAVTGATTIWRPPRKRELLSNQGAVRLVEA